MEEETPRYNFRKRGGVYNPEFINKKNKIVDEEDSSFHDSMEESISYDKDGDLKNSKVGDFFHGKKVKGYRDRGHPKHFDFFIHEEVSNHSDNSDGDLEGDPEGDPEDEIPSETPSETPSENLEDGPSNDQSDDQSGEEYFKQDNSMLENMIAKSVLERIPNVPAQELKDAIYVALEQAGDVVEEYAEAIPADLRWKTKADEDEVQRLEPTLSTIRRSINEDEPSLKNILLLAEKKKLPFEDFKRLVMKFDIYNNTEPYTREFLDLRDSLVHKIREGERNVPIDDDTEAKINYFLKNIPSSDQFSIQRRILNLQASDNIKMRLFEIFQNMNAHKNSSEDYSNLKSKLEFALELPYQKLGGMKDINIYSANQYCVKIRKELDKELYGMEDVKDELICALNNRITNPKAKTSICLKGTKGTGKCLGKDTPILMYDGSIKMVQDVRKGDLLMGDNSKPRTVLSTTTGTEMLYLVMQSHGASYIVNESHILSLKNHIGEIKDICVKDYLDLQPSDRAQWKGYKVPILYKEVPTLLEPALFGYHLVTNNEYMYIPREYMINSYSVRSNLLKGILNGYGHNTTMTKETFKTELTNNKLAKDIVRLSESLGIYTVSETKNDVTTITGHYYIKDLSDITLYPKGEGRYYGFEIDGNRRFVLGDFTVTHNTSIASALFKALGLPFERISLGGFSDATQLKGSDQHWVGSGPSLILQILKRMKVSNGGILFDEIDKIADTHHGIEVVNSLLHITDYTQNNEFQDTYLNEFPHDISNIWFMFSCNDDNLIDPILRDRLHILNVESYSRDGLKQIMKNYQLPKSLNNVDMPLSLVTIEDKAYSLLIDMYCEDIRDQGARPTQKALDTLISRINLLRTNLLPDGTLGELHVGFTVPPNFKFPVIITRDMIKQLMPHKKKIMLPYII